MQWIEQLKQLRSLYFMFICFNLPFSLYEPGINILLEVDKFQISNGTKMISRKGIAEVFSLGPRIVKIIWQKKLKCILIIIIFIKLKFWAARSEAHEVPSLPKQVQNTVGRNTEVYFLPWIDMADSGDKNFLLYDIHERYGPFSLTLYREKWRNQCFFHNFGLPDKMKHIWPYHARRIVRNCVDRSSYFMSTKSWRSVLLFLWYLGQYHGT